MNPVRRAGFTLIEVTVALVVGGMALSAAAALLSGLSDREQAIRADAARVDREANAERLLRDLWDNLRLTSDSAVRGDSTTASFQSWCPSVEGWLRPCRATLTLDRDGVGFRLRLELASTETRTLTLWRGARDPARLRYLRDAASGGTWESHWSGLVAPSALEVIAGADTMLLPTW